MIQVFQKRMIQLLLVFSITISLQAKERLLLLDMSGSIKENQLDQQMIKVVSRFLNEPTNKDILVYGFNDNIFQITEDLSKGMVFEGKTNLSGALNAITPSAVSSVHLICDGEADKPQEAIKAAQRLKSEGAKLCTVFLSKHKQPIPQMLQSISDFIFLANNVAQAFQLCQNYNKKPKLHSGSVKKSFDPNQYNLFN